MEPRSDPTNCMRCYASLERGWTDIFVGGKLTESICFSCSKAEQLSEFSRTGRLTTQLITWAAIDRARAENGRAVPNSTPPTLLTSLTVIEAEVLHWQQAVWFAGLQQKVRKAKYRGMRLSHGDSKTLVWSSAGRVLFTIEGTDGHITLIAAEEGVSVVGIQGIYATEPEALRLLTDSREAYKAGGVFSRDDNVGL